MEPRNSNWAAHHVHEAPQLMLPRGRWDRNRTGTLRFWSPGFVHLWAFMRCRCMSPLGIVRGRIGRQVSLSVGLVRSCRGQL
jgi:hypothetical protein